MTGMTVQWSRFDLDWATTTKSVVCMAAISGRRIGLAVGNCLIIAPHISIDN
jgi:hypothetical protein